MATQVSIMIDFGIKGLALGGLGRTIDISSVMDFTVIMFQA
jgi:hypothetical protein